VIEEPAPRGSNSAFLVVLVLCAAGAGSTAIAPSHWLRGVLIIGIGLGIGAVLRATLPQRYLGLLAVRSRVLDTLIMGALAVLIVTVGLLIPH
jgi:hypothetical protein